ncbi:branched-chain amino acid ABC transporter permease [Xanthobacter sediminis]|jgi:branched-chain amino acid transport system permease protein
MLQFFDKWPYGLIIGTVLIAALAIRQYLLTSRTGYYWRALRDNEEAAEALGVDARAYKLRCFMLSAGISALCSAFYANYVAFVDPRSMLGIDLSIQMLVYSIIGGMALLCCRQRIQTFDAGLVPSLIPTAIEGDSQGLSVECDR